MTIHNKGRKADRDRAVLINSYHVMVRDFRVPKARRLDDARLASMSNEMLLKVNRDIYSQATVKQANALAVKMGLIHKPQSWIGRKITQIQVDFDLWRKSIQLAKANKEATRA